jgi:DNA-binding response OmpR family regulator
MTLIDHRALTRFTGSEEETGGNAAERASVLVVEDEPLIRMAIADYLQDHGFKVFEAANADEAMRFLQYGDVNVSLVFSDIQLGPGCNGIDLAVWSKIHFPDVRIALTSGNPKLVEDARLHEEAVAVFAKPYEFRRLTIALKALIAAGNDP